MTTYREKRNIIKSIIDKLTDDLDTDWHDFNIRVEKAFSRVYNKPLPCILVEILTKDKVTRELGSNSKINYYVVEIRIFAKDDGTREDLSDWLGDVLEGKCNGTGNDGDIDYYEYEITDGESSSELKGRIVITKFLNDKKELQNSENLAEEDKHRHLISFKCYVTRS